MNFFHHKDLVNHLLQLYPKVVKHPVFAYNLFGLTTQKKRIIKQKILKFVLEI